MADKCLPRMGIMSFLGTIVNGRQRAEGEAVFDEISLMRRIELRNLIKADMTLSTARELYRLLWLTYE